MGLLTKANLLDLNKRLAFSDFILKYKIKTFAVFSKKEKDYYISNSLGFDGVSIFESVSTEDFWKGICKEDKKIYTYPSSDRNNPLLQFFSFKIKDDIKDVSVYKSDNSILMLCNQPMTEEIIKDYASIDYNYSNLNVNKLNDVINHESILYKLQIDFDEAIQTFIYTKLTKKDFSDEFTKSLFNELSNRILFAYNYPDASVKLFDNKILSIFISNQPVSDALLINHLILNYKSVIDSAAEVINIEFLGKAETINDVKDFLKVE